MDVSTNGLNSPHSSTSLSRFPSQVILGQDEIPVYCQSPLSRGASFRGEDSLPTLISDHKENVDNSKKDRRNVDSIGNQFHFSIYKWAGREVPMLLPLMGRDKKKVSDGYDRSASSNGRIETKLSARVVKNRGLSAAGTEALKMEPKKEDLRSQEDVKEVQDFIDEKVLNETPEVKSRISANQSVVSGGARQNIKERAKSLDGVDVQVKAEKEVPLRKGESGRYENINVQEKSEKQVPLKKEDSLRFEIKALRTFLRDETDSQEKTEEKFPLSKEESLQPESMPLHAFLDSGMELPGDAY